MVIVVVTISVYMRDRSQVVHNVLVAVSVMNVRVLPSTDVRHSGAAAKVKDTAVSDASVATLWSVAIGAVILVRIAAVLAAIC